MNEEMKTILILDDDDAVRESFEYYFEDQGWLVTTSGSAEEALVLLKNETMHSAIVDVRLPGINGDEFIREINNLGIKMAIVICTGSPEYQVPESVKAIPLVSEDVFSKPVSDMNLIEQALSRQIEKVF